MKREPHDVDDTSTIRITVIVFTAVMVFGWATPGVQAADATLTYSKPSQIYRAEPFGLTVTFGVAVSSADITITGGDVGSTANDVWPAASLTPTAPTPTAEWTFTRTVQSGDDGAFTVEIEADGVTKTVDDPTFDVDTVAPDVALTYDQGDQLYQAEAIFITATFTEDAVSAPTISIGDGTVGGITVTAEAMTDAGDADAKTWAYTTTVVAGDATGSRAVTIAGTDLAGNPNNAATNATFTIDTTAPDVSLMYDQGDKLYKAEAIFITATFTEDAVSAPMISIGDGTVGGITVTAVAMTDAGDADAKTWAYTTTVVAGDATGSRSVTIAGTDLAGNANNAATNATFTIDASAPDVALTYDQGDQLYQAEAIFITATFTEDAVSAPTISIGDGTVGGIT
ncbi:MAG: hypothetical protein HY814_04085, partial [Candidatus Riflebacteria bacterium]|nr:hypothetical protein [Candidatus Riflebacteria bacterium]